MPGPLAPAGRPWAGASPAAFVASAAFPAGCKMRGAMAAVLVILCCVLQVSLSLLLLLLLHLLLA